MVEKYTLWFAKPAIFMKSLLPSSRIKIILVTLLILLAGASFIYNQVLINRIMEQERKNVQLWAKAFEHTYSPIQTRVSNNLNMVARELQNTPAVPDSLRRIILESENLAITNDFVQKEIIRPENLFNIPVILADESGFVLNARFIGDYGKEPEELLDEFAQLYEPIVIEFGDEGNPLRNYVYYGESPTIRYLRFFPYVQFGILALLLGIGYTTYKSIKKSEQSNLWVGMTKEAAHQLGTPLSSIYGWLQLLKDRNQNDDETLSITYEIENDVSRLKGIAERFNKIGSQPELKPLNLESIVDDVVTYMERRLPQLGKHIEVRKDVQETSKVEINSELFKWAIENLIKNAMDAIREKEDDQFLAIRLWQEADYVTVEIEDSGTGIEKKNVREIFKPGFSTKKRGWGLGLSLTRRIIEDYHKGKLYVQHTEVGKGTAIRIELPVYV